MSEVPPYITPAEIGKICKMTTKAARGMLRRAGILERLGGVWVVDESRLRERLPPVYDRVFAWFVLEDRDGPRRTETAQDGPREGGL
jgi:hypothetical protein